eukprot:TRINITY_DN16041_c0_g1_i1.p1 TRINITY_DN16041_c0_g1~~TRINITY_DN16041_c0_g1_i1.p1  ORF type:complete len:349 (+),score=64.33 TRINITY_DN16041_c0_g1_i1:57-1103(+)
MAGATTEQGVVVVDERILEHKLEADTPTTVSDESGDETSPTTLSECSDARDDELEIGGKDATANEPRELVSDEAKVETSQLGPGLFYDAEEAEKPLNVCEPALAPIVSQVPQKDEQHVPANENGSEPRDSCEAAPCGDQSGYFTPEETLFVFDWDDTILPSSWLQRHGLRLDDASVVEDWQRDLLAEVADVAGETFRLAKQHGTVVLLTNAERGWIELSCQKFMPGFCPWLDDVKIVSARTTYESPQCKSPLDWKVKAFEDEIARACGYETLIDASKRKNIHSIGDSVHEREALLRSTCSLPSCRSKSLKLVERPDISQIVKQHNLVTSCFDQIVHHDGNLDLFISCS